MVCMECGAVDEIEEDLLEDVERRVEKEFNFKNFRPSINFSWYLS